MAFQDVSPSKNNFLLFLLLLFLKRLVAKKKYTTLKNKILFFRWVLKVGLFITQLMGAISIEWIVYWPLRWEFHGLFYWQIKLVAAPVHCALEKERTENFHFCISSPKIVEKKEIFWFASIGTYREETQLSIGRENWVVENSAEKFFSWWKRIFWKKDSPFQWPNRQALTTAELKIWSWCFASDCKMLSWQH